MANLARALALTLAAGLASAAPALEPAEEEGKVRAFSNPAGLESFRFAGLTPKAEPREKEAAPPKEFSTPFEYGEPRRFSPDYDDSASFTLRRFMKDDPRFDSPRIDKTDVVLDPDRDFPREALDRRPLLDNVPHEIDGLGGDAVIDPSPAVPEYLLRPGDLLWEPPAEPRSPPCDEEVCPT